MVENLGLKAKDITLAYSIIRENKEVIKEHWRHFFLKINNMKYKVWLDELNIYVERSDGELASLAINLFPMLLRATPLQRNNFTLGYFGIHWEELDEDLSYSVFFK